MLRNKNGYSILASLALLIAFFASCALPANAQFVGDSDISVSIVPENPGAFQDTTITLSSFSTDLNLATIRWSIGGKTALSGIGKKAYSFRTGAIGQSTTIDIAVDITNVPTITKSIVVTPLETDLLWEAVDSYVPPFYKGKALLPSEGMVKVVAIPNIRNTGGTLLKPADFSYTWTRNYNADTAASGYGKNYFIFRTSYLNDQERVTVSLSSLTGDYRAAKNLSLTTIAPNVLVYENNPEQGIVYSRALKSDSYFKVGSRGASFIAEPYFFSPKNAIVSHLDYAWTVNGTPIDTPAVKNIFSVRPEQSGVAEIKVSVDNIQKLFQAASRTLLITLDTNE